MNFNYSTFMAMTNTRTPAPGVHESYNFGRSFYGHQYCIPSLSYKCLGLNKKILKEIKHFYLNVLYGHVPAKNPCPWGHEISSLCRPFLGHHYCILNLSDLWQGVGKKFFKERMHFDYNVLNGQALAQEPLSRWSWKLQCNFEYPFLDHHYFLLSLSHLCLAGYREVNLGVKKYCIFTIWHISTL